MGEKSKFLKIAGTVCTYLLALTIPVFLVMAVMQSRHYSEIESDVVALNEKQAELIESNKTYVTDISVLASSERIERVALEELGMRKADTNEIVRISIEGNKK